MMKIFLAIFAVILLVAAIPKNKAKSYQPRAVVELNPGTLNLGDGTAASKANWIRMRMVSVNGQTGNYILASGHGPQEGYIGEINSIISDDLGAILNEMDISECADIPTTGSGSTELTDDGETFTVTATFSAGAVVIPAHYDGSGETLAKRIVLSEEGEEYLLLELTCEANDLITVYALMPETADNPRAREVYFQQVPSTSETRVDVHMTNSTDQEKYITRFHYENDVARIWTIRTLGAGTGSGEAAVINTTSGLFHSQFHIGSIANTDTNTFTDLGAGFCIDMNTNEANADCTAEGLAVTNPSDTSLVNGTAHSFTMNSVRTMTIGDI
ncbi:MAG: hypothetical protein AB7O96_08660 [Pseudobdellovibrionaceae bacterium]